MTLAYLTLIGVIPAVLVVLAGTLVLRMGPQGAANRRFLLFLLVAETGLLLVVFVVGLIPPGQNSGLTFSLAMPLVPTLLGLLALILTRLKVLAGLPRRDKVLAALLALGLVALLAGVWLQPFGWGQEIVLGALVLASAWWLGSISDGVVVILTLVGAAEIALINSDRLSAWMAQAPFWVAAPLTILLYTFPGLAVVAAALWVKGALGRPAWAKAPIARPDDVSPGMHPNSSQPETRSGILIRGLRLAPAAALLGGVAYTIAWATIWDQTSDGIGGVWFMMQGSLAAIAAGIFLGVTTTGWRRVAGLAFGVLASLAMIGAFQQKWPIYHPITEAHATRIQQAVESFYARAGRYPTALGELMPRELLWVPGPVLLRGEGWCYQGGADYYRLGTYYREAFSMPLSFRIYASAGSPPSGAWACADRLAELKARYDPPPFPLEGKAPTQAPLPTSAVPIERTPLQPLVRAPNIQVGTNWSPDGEYLIFGVPAASGGQRRVTLNFLNATTGEVCQVAESFPGGQGYGANETQGHYAWLADGRLLYLSTMGDLVRLTPCRPGLERLTDRYPEKFQLVAASEGKGRYVLLKSQSAYWLLDSVDMAVRQVAGVTPNPYELHWDKYAWSPKGDQLAISRLNGRDKTGGSTLYVVATAGGEVLQTLPLAAASDQSAPMVDWLTDHELLVADGTLTLMDLQAAPPRSTNVFKDIFALQAVPPNDTASMGWLADPSGTSYHLVARMNQARNKATYLYHSETGAVEVLHPELDAVLFFPGGDWTEMTKFPEDTAPERDEYELFWVDASERGSRRLVVQGHAPRSYPALYVKYWPQQSALLFCSAQGLSAVSVPDGKLLAFWTLQDRLSGLPPYVLVPPTGGGLVVVADGDGLYFVRP